MESGACELVAGGGCITSPNFLTETGERYQYPHDSSCVISLNSAAALVVFEFDVEESYDYLQIGRSAWSGPKFTGRISDSAVSSDSNSDSESNSNDHTGWTDENIDTEATSWASIPLTFKVGSGFAITFSSDSSVSSEGFNICTRQAGETVDESVFLQALACVAISDPTLTH